MMKEEINIAEYDTNSLLEKKEQVSVLTAGYIVLTNDKIIKIREDQSHNDIISLLLFHLGNCEKYEKYEFLDGVKKLTDHGHLVYFGVTSTSLKKGGLEVGHICLPESPTDFQKQFICILNCSNKSCIREKKLLDIIYLDLTNGLKKIGREKIKEKIPGIYDI